jgi:catechol 2,3-dioxygenase-like lactoylglutathione lyase family enzyme
MSTAADGSTPRCSTSSTSPTCPPASCSPTAPERAPADDHFDEARIGLDHLSLQVDSRQALEQAIATFDANGVSHGEIKDLGEGSGIYVLAFRDPDNIQLELTAPRA